jgi:serine/threonine protein kinase
LQGRGTVAYTPLEQYGGEVGHTDVRSDIYSLGATLYHLLTNQAPIDAKQRFLHPEALAAPIELNPQISPQVEQAMLHALAMHPTGRPSTVADFKSELLTKNTHESTAPAEQPVWRKAFMTNRFLVAACIALLILAFVVTMVPISPQKTTTPTPQPPATITAPILTP